MRDYVSIGFLDVSIKTENLGHNTLLYRQTHMFLAKSHSTQHYLFVRIWICHFADNVISQHNLKSGYIGIWWPKMYPYQHVKDYQIVPSQVILVSFTSTHPFTVLFRSILIQYASNTKSSPDALLNGFRTESNKLSARCTNVLSSLVQNFSEVIHDTYCACSITFGPYWWLDILCTHQGSWVILVPRQD